MRVDTNVAISQFSCASSLRRVTPFQLTRTGPHSSFFYLAVGTIIYRAIIREYQDRYISAPKLEKGKLVLAIVKGVTSIGGRFLRVKRGSWVEVSVEKARQQTSYALRQERRGMSPELAGGVRKSQSQPVKRQCMHEEYGDQEANLLVLKTAT